jgi:hypothetical protein
MPTTYRHRPHRGEHLGSINQVASYLQFIIDRVDSIEGRTSTTRGTNAHQGRSRLVKEAANDKTDFGKLYRALCRFVQLKHHFNNWKFLPRSLQAKLDNLVSSIWPPGADDDVLGDIMFLGCQFGASLANTVRLFLQQKIDETLDELKQCTRVELPRAKELTDWYIAGKLPRLEKGKRLHLIDEGADIVGASHERVNFQPPEPNLTNSNSNLSAGTGAVPIFAVDSSLSNLAAEMTVAPSPSSQSTETNTATGIETAIEVSDNESETMEMSVPDSVGPIKSLQASVIATVADADDPKTWKLGHRYCNKTERWMYAEPGPGRVAEGTFFVMDPDDPKNWKNGAKWCTTTKRWLYANPGPHRVAEGRYFISSRNVKIKN